MNAKEQARFRKTGISQINIINNDIKQDLRKEWIAFKSFGHHIKEEIKGMNIFIEQIKTERNIKDSDIKKKVPLVIRVKYNPNYNLNHMYKMLVDQKFVKFIVVKKKIEIV